MLFITGSLRSGTTLVDRLLTEFEDVDSFSQPLPLILVEAKQAFLNKIRHPAAGQPYPLSDQQFANSYPLAQFRDFLGQNPLADMQIQSVLDRMDEYSGQHFRTSLDARHAVDWRIDSVTGFASQYFELFGNAAPVNAWKEVVAEEFIPSFLDEGCRVILVLRDPRDVAVSLNLGSNEYVGKNRPLLWIARQWRKSAAYALRYAGDPKVLLCRYEDVVRDPESMLLAWRKFLGPGPAPAWRRDAPLRGIGGEPWRSNSSFEQREGIFQEGIGRYAKLLSGPMLRLLEALCFAEMRALGYSPVIDREQIEHIISSAAHEVALRPALSEYAWSPERRSEELERWRRLLSDHPDYDGTMFLFEQSYHSLRRAMEV